MAEDRWRDLPVLIAAAAPGVLLRLSGAYLRFLTQRRRGERAFRQELLAAGIPRDRAAQLTQAYHDAGSFRRFVARPAGEGEGRPR